MAPVRPYKVLRTTCYEKVRHTTVATCTELFRFGQFVVQLSHSLDRIYRNNLGIYSTFIHIRSRMSRGLVLSAALAVVAMSSSANAGVAMVQSEGLFKGEELINFAKTLVGDALDFVGGHGGQCGDEDENGHHEAQQQRQVGGFHGIARMGV